MGGQKAGRPVLTAVPPSLSSIRCWFNCRPARRNRTLPRLPFQSPSVSSCGGSQGVMSSWQLLVGPIFPPVFCWVKPKMLMLPPTPTALPHHFSSSVTASPLVCPPSPLLQGTLARARGGGQATPQRLVVKTGRPRAQVGIRKGHTRPRAGQGLSERCQRQSMEDASVTGLHILMLCPGYLLVAGG